LEGTKGRNNDDSRPLPQSQIVDLGPKRLQGKDGSKIMTSENTGAGNMPGPKFSQKIESSKNWIKNNYQRLVIGAIIVLLAIGGYFFYQSYHQRQVALTPVVNDQEQTQTNEPAGPSPSAAKDNETVSPEVKGAKTTPEITEQDGNITAKAAKGNGATHLARQAFKEYAKDKSLDLKKEQKIYIEDYLQKHAKKDSLLHPGSEITFSEQEMKDAVDHAQKLTDKQIQNLSKYVPLVPSL